MKSPLPGAIVAATLSLLAACAPVDRGPPAAPAAPNGTATNNIAQFPGHEAVAQAATRGADARLPAYVPGEVLVKFRARMPTQGIALAKGGGTVVSKRVFHSVGGLQLLKLGNGATVEQALASLHDRPDVEYAEPNYIYRQQALPNDPSFTQQWALDNTGQTQGTADADIDAPEAWNLTTGADSTVVAVIDSGVDYTHPDLAPNMFTNAGDCDHNQVDDDGDGYVDDCHGIDVVDGDSDPMDENGHGTHVAGIIAARGNNGIGVSGVAWNARVVACRFIDQSGQGSAADAIACLDYVAALHDHGVNVVATNNSWGNGIASRALQDAIDRQRQRGILFVAAAGNAASPLQDHNLGTNGYLFESGAMFPCSYPLPNVICVAASDAHDNLASFSYYGINNVHVFAPGDAVLSTLPGGAYGELSGTSMATPQVTGVIALLKSATPSMSWQEARSRVLAGGDLITRDSRYPDVGWPALSHRRLNAYGALTCTNSEVLRRLEPHTTNPDEDYAVGAPITLSVLHLNCTGPAGAVSVSLSPGNDIPLHDDGLDGDLYAGDGVYTAQWTPPTARDYTLTFPGAPLVVPDGSGVLAPDRLAIHVMPYLKRGFPLRALHTGGQMINYPSNFVANLDGGADLEIVTSGFNNGPNYAWKPDGSVLPGWPLDRNGRPGHAGYYAAANLDDDPATLEIIGSAADDGTNQQTDTRLGDPFEAFSSSGEMLPGWPRASLNFIRSLPLVVDFDLDGHDDMFVGGGDGYLRGFRRNGDVVPGFEYGLQPSLGGQYVNTPLAADLDGDGRPELVLTGVDDRSNVLAIINGASGTAVKRELQLPQRNSLFAIGDVDGDGTMNLLATSSEPDGAGGFTPVIRVLSPEGKTVRTFPYAAGSWALNGTALADLDGDGIPEIVLSLSNFDSYWQLSDLEVSAFHGDGSVVSGFPVIVKSRAPLITGVPTMSAPVVGDLQGGGRPSIVVIADGDLAVVNHDGSLYPGTPFRLPSEFWVFQVHAITPIIADLEGDGRNDIVLTTNYWNGLSGWYPKVYAFDLGGASNHGPIEWGQELGDASRQGAYQTGKNLPSEAYLAILTRGDGHVVSSTPAFDCHEHCLRRYDKHAPLQITATPTASGTFLGWRGACAGQGANCALTLSGYAATSAIFSTKTLTVNVTGPGHVKSDRTDINCPANCTAEYASTDTVVLTAIPDASATFSGWSGSPACSGKSLTCTLSMSSAQSVSARFDYQQSLYVSVNNGGGSIVVQPLGVTCATFCSLLIDYGTAVTLTPVPDDGRTVHWGTGPCSGSGATCTITMTDAKSVVVDFVTPARMTISRSGDGSGSITSVPAGIDCGTTCTAVFPYETTLRLIATPAADSLLTGWTNCGPGSEGIAGDCYITLYGDVSLTANFIRGRTLTVTHDGVGRVFSYPEGIDCGTDCSELYRPGTSVMLTASALGTNSFVGWTGACQGSSSTCQVTLDQARDVTATFVPWLSLTVMRGGTGDGTISVPAGNIRCGSVCSDLYPPGTQVALVATPQAENSFTGWSGACQGTGDCVVTMDQAHSVTASFAPWPKLTVTRAGDGNGAVASSPSGIDCGTDCTQLYAPGTQVTLSAIPSAGSDFDSWNGACTGSATSCTVVVGADMSIGSRFTPTPPPPPPPTPPAPVVIPAGGGGGGGRLDLWMLAMATLLVAQRVRSRLERSRTQGHRR